MIWLWVCFGILCVVGLVYLAAVVGLVGLIMWAEKKDEDGEEW